MNWTSYELLMILWRASWQAAVLAMVVYATCRISHKAIPPSAKTLLWLLPMLRLIVLVVPATSFSIFNATAILDSSESPAVQHTLDSSAFSLQAGLQSRGQLVSSEKPVIDASPALPSAEIPDLSMNAEHAFAATHSPLHEDNPSSSPNATWINSFSVSNVLITVWMSGLCFGLIRYMVAQVTLQRIISKGKEIDLHEIIDSDLAEELTAAKQQPVRFVAIENSYGPAVAGVVRPNVILPQSILESCSQQEIEMIIRHELEHVRRFDTSILLLAQFALLLHWFNPLVYWLKKHLQTQIEISVDAATLRKLGTEKIKQYAELLFRIANSNSTPTFVVSMARRSCMFRYRIEQLAEVKPHHPIRSLVGAIAVIVLAFAGLSDATSQEPLASVRPSIAVANQSEPTEAVNSLPSGTQQTEGRAASQDQEPTGMAFKAMSELEQWTATGKVVDSQGNGVPNASLFYSYGTSNELVRTDSEGNYSISYPRQYHMYDSFFTWVFAEGYGLRVVAMRGYLAEEANVAGVTIPLPPLEEKPTEIEVVDPSGKPIEGALVTPRTIELPNGRFLADESTGLSSDIPKQLIESLGVRTNKEGKAFINRFPNKLWHGIYCQTDQFGVQLLENVKTTGKIRIKLREVGSIRGRITSFDSSKMKPLMYFIQTASPAVESATVGYAVGQFDENGEFSIPAIATGSIARFIVGEGIRLNSLRDNEFMCEDYQSMKLLSGQTLDLKLISPPTARVSGVVLTSDTRQPVPGTVIASYRQDGPHHRTFITDENGRFEFRVVPGKVELQMISIGSLQSLKYGFERLPDQIVEDTELEVLLPVRKSIKGRLQDTSGKPLAKQSLVRVTGPYQHIYGFTESDANGNFEMFVVDGNLGDTDAFWAIGDIAEYSRTGAIKTVVNQISKEGDFYILEQPTEPIPLPKPKRAVRGE